MRTRGGIGKKLATLGLVLAVNLGSFLFALHVQAVNTDTLSFQATIAAKNQKLLTGRYSFRFTLFTQQRGGRQVWQETWRNENKVPVQQGLFSVRLGSVRSLTKIDFSIQDYYLNVEFDPNNDGIFNEPFAARIPITQTRDVVAPVATRSFDVTGLSGVLKVESGVLMDEATTGDLTEGVNLYYSDERVDDRVAALLQSSLGLTWSYDDVNGILSAAVSAVSDNPSTLTAGNGLTISSNTVTANLNSTNLQITSGQINTIQDIATTSNPQFAGLTVAGNLNIRAANPLRYYDTDSSNYVAFQAPRVIGTDVTWTLPSVDGAGCLVSDGAGTLSWTTCSGGGGGAPTDASYLTLGTNAALSAERVLTGTSNQIILTDNGAGGTIVLSLPQSIATSSSPTFANITSSTLTSGRVTYAGASGLLQDSANMTFDGSRLSLATSGVGGGLLIGDDANLYRTAANTLKTDDSVVVGGAFSVTGLTTLATSLTGALQASSGVVSADTLPINLGGTGQTTASTAINALVPTQTGNSGNYLTTNGTAISWAAISSGPSTLGDLSDATITSVVDGELLVYDGGTSNWINQTLAEAGVAATGDLHAAASVSDSSTIDLTLSGQQITGIVIVDSINDTHIDWGTGINQVSLDDLPDGTSYERVAADQLSSGIYIDASTSIKGIASFTAADFDATTGNISIDYTNGQAASSGANGFLSAADWSTFNAKQTAGNYITALTGDVTASGPGSVAATIASGAVSLSKMADMATASFIGRNTAGAGSPEILSASTAKSILAIAQADVSGLTAASSPTFAGIALGTGSLTMTGSLGATGARLTKGWFTDLEVTNAIAGSITGSSGSTTGNAATVTNGVYTTDTGTVTSTMLLDGTIAAADIATGAVTAPKLQAAAADLGAANVTVDFGNTNGAFNTNITTDGTITATTFVGALTGNASTVTTNANLTGPITSVGNATSVAAQTGTGSTFVMNTSPTLVTPILGVATATSINKLTLTQPATGSTLTIDDGFTLHVTGNVTALSGSSTGSNTGDQTNITGNAATVTTNANLTGPITSVGNATSVAAQTGTGSTFVMNTSPTLVTPILGAATATSIAIGANTLNTSEWAYLDGVNQTLATTSSPQFVGLTLTGTAALDGGITVDTNNFTVSGTTGATAIAGAMTTGTALGISYDTATQTGALTGLAVDLTNITADGTNTLYGIKLDDAVSNTASTEYGIYQAGTNWDYGGYFEDNLRTTGLDIQETSVDPKIYLSYYQAGVSGNTTLNIAGTGSDSAAVGTVTWSNPSYITIDDNNKAAAYPTAGNPTHYLKASNFGFSIPDGTTVVGVEVTVNAATSTMVSNGTARYDIVRLVNGSGTVVGDDKSDDSTLVNLTLTDKTFGGAADSWNASLTASDVNNANFGVVVSLAQASLAPYAMVDYIKVKVYYATTEQNYAWAAGIDESDSGAFVISRSASLGTNNALVLDASSNVTVSANLNVTGTTTLASALSGMLKASSGVISAASSDVDFQQVVTWGDGLAYAAGTGSVDYNTTNLKITTAQLNTIQDIATASSPTFANLTDSGLTSGRITYASTAGLLVDSANMTFDGNMLSLVTQGVTGGLNIGTDTNLYRSAADTLKTDDKMMVSYSSAGASSIRGLHAAATQTVALTGTVTGAYLTGSANQTTGTVDSVIGAQVVAYSNDGTTTNMTGLDVYGSRYGTAATTTYKGINVSDIQGNITVHPTANIASTYGIYINNIDVGVSSVGLYIADAGTYSLQLASTDGDAASGITFGTDTNLYRSAANTLKTDDAFVGATTITALGVGNGTLNIGNSTSPQGIVHIASNSSATAVIERAETSANSGILQFRKARNTVASPGAVSNGDALGGTSFFGYQNSAYQYVASILSSVDAVPSGSVVQGNLTFNTANSAGTVTQALKLDSSQNATFAGTVNTTGLTLNMAQDYVFGVRATTGYMSLQSQTAGTANHLEMYTKDGDGTDDVPVMMFGKGLPTDITNSEFLSVGYNATAVAYTMNVEAAGTGTIRSLILQTNTSNALEVDSSQVLWVGSTKDTNLYRGAANELRTDDLLSFGSTKDATAVDFKTYKTINAANKIGFIFDTSAAVTSGSLMSVRNNGTAKFGINYDGKVVMASTLTQSGTPADIAENVQVSDSSIEAGDIVAADPGSPETARKAVAGDQRLMGVISTDPGILISGGTNGKPLTLAGRVPVKIVADAGIKIGDTVIISDQPGLGTKGSNKIAPMVGVALTDQQVGVPTVMVQVQIGVYLPMFGNSLANEVLSPQYQSVLDSFTILDNDLLHIDNLSVDRLEVASLTVNGRIVADSLALSNRSAGRSTIEAGQTSVFVTTDLVESNDQIIISAIEPATADPQPISLYRSTIDDNTGFWVKMLPNQALPYDQPFDWLIIK